VFGKIINFGKKDNKEKNGISQDKNTTLVTESTAGVSSQHVGLEIEGLLPWPVTPCMPVENVGRESPTNEIAHMEIVENMDRHLSTPINRMGPVNLKKWKRVARNRADAVSTKTWQKER
jgi:hypothetical protein